MAIIKPIPRLKKVLKTAATAPKVSTRISFGEKVLQIRERVATAVIAPPEVVDQIVGVIAATKYRQKQTPTIPAPRVIVSGPTSSGKSYLAGVAASILGLRTITINCGLLTPEGYKGASLSDALMPLAKSPKNETINGVSAPVAVLILDEFDKIFMRCGQDNSWYSSILYSLLGLIGGEVISLENPLGASYEINTSNLLIFATGTFVGIGSTAWATTASAIKALMAYGLSEELIGRITHFICLKKHSDADMHKLIVRHAKEFETLFSSPAEAIQISEFSLKKIEQEIAQSSLGIRSLNLHLYSLYTKYLGKIDNTIPTTGI